MQYSFEQFYGVGVNPNVSGDYQGEGSPLGFAYRIPTIIPVYDIMGNFAGSRGDKLGNAQNPLAMLYRAKDNVNKRNFFFGNVYAEVDPVNGLTPKFQHRHPIRELQRHLAHLSEPRILRRERRQRHVGKPGPEHGMDLDQYADL